MGNPQNQCESVVGVAVTDLAGTVRSLNDSWLERHGYSLEDLPQLVGQPVAVFHPAAQLNRELKPFLERGLKSGSQHARLDHLRRDRTTFNTWTTLNLLYQGSGSPAAMVLTLGAPADTGDVALALRASEARYRRLVEHAADAFFLHDLEARIIDVNQSACDSLGYSREELLQLTLGEIDEVFEMARARQIWARMEPGVPFSFENRHRRKDGTTFPVEVRLGRLESEGRPLVLALARDITRRRQVEQERHQIEIKMQQSQKLESLGVLAGGIAHDFNNLLTSILGNAGLAAMQLPRGLPARHLVDTIETVATRATELTQQLLAYAGKGSLSVEPLNLSRLVDEMTGLLKVSIPKKVKFSCSLGQSLPPVTGDPGKIRQVVMNLILNAAESIGDAPGTISLTTRLLPPGHRLLPAGEGERPGSKNGFLCLEVSDTGCGMDEETRRRIFDPFFTTKFTGRGLGLAAVLGIIRGHDGSIDVRSQPGEGATFTILLPAEGVLYETEVNVEPALPVPVQTSSEGTILVVDDDSSIREIARLILERAGYKVLVASDGQEAVELFRQEAVRINSVLLDMTMPGLDGREALEAIHAVDAAARIILMSGYSAGEVAGRFAGNEVAGFLQKPFRAVQLIEKVRSILDT